MKLDITFVWLYFCSPLPAFPVPPVSSYGLSTRPRWVSLSLGSTLSSAVLPAASVGGICKREGFSWFAARMTRRRICQDWSSGWFQLSSHLGPLTWMAFLAVTRYPFGYSYSRPCATCWIVFPANVAIPAFRPNNSVRSDSLVFFLCFPQLAQHGKHWN
jgi:hypothetical protein